MTELLSRAAETLLRYAQVPGIGSRKLVRIAECRNFADLDPRALAAANPKMKFLPDEAAWRLACSGAEEQKRLAAGLGVRILCFLDPDYPALLADSPDKPAILYVKGALSATPEKSLAVIGTREPTEHGRLAAGRIAGHFAARGWSIVSGLAAGCDAAAHAAAIRAGGHTVAVMAHGLHTVMPAQNRALADEILASGGALVSEFPLGQDSTPGLFAARDKTQAGLSQGVVLVQSAIDGGSLHASRAALHYGRWLAVAAPTGRDRASADPRCGAALVLDEGAEVEKLQLLKCKKVQELEKLIILRSRNDYALIEERPLAALRCEPQATESLF